MEDLMLKQRYLALVALLVLIAISACSSNKQVIIEEPEPEPQPLELALLAAAEGADYYEDQMYDAAILAFTNAKKLFEDAAPTASEADSIALNIESMKLNIAKSHADLAYENMELTLYNDALQHYQSALAIYQSHQPVRITREELDRDILGTINNMAIVTQQAGMYEKTVEYYDEILKAEPDNERILNLKFNVLSNNLQDDERAFEALSDYANVANSAPAYVMLAERYTEKRNFAAAEAAYMKALALREDADMYARLGNFFRASSQWGKANTYLEKLVATNPDEQTLALVYKQIGQNFMQLGNSTKMAEFLEKSVAIDRDPNTALSLASHFNGSKNWAKVITYSTMVLNSDVNNAAARMLRGVAYLQQKNYPSARADLERIQNDSTYGAQVQGILKSLPK
jgi:tetratricopeptide (TPR) repeat protein